MNAKQFQRLRQRVEELQKQKAQAEGALQSQLKQLREEFDVVTVRAGERLLRKLGQEQAAAEKKYQQLLADFEETWKDVL